MNVPSWKGRVLFVPNVDAGAATHSPPLPLPSVLKLLMDHVSDKMKVTVRCTDTRVSATHRASTGDAVSAEAAKSAHPNSPRDPRHFPGCFAHFRWCHVTRTSCCMPPSSLLPGGCGKPRGYNVGGSLSWFKTNHRLLHAHSVPGPVLGISVRSRLILTAPRGKSYLWFTQDETEIEVKSLACVFTADKLAVDQAPTLVLVIRGQTRVDRALCSGRHPRSSKSVWPRVTSVVPVLFPWLAGNFISLAFHSSWQNWSLFSPVFKAILHQHFSNC